MNSDEGRLYDELVRQLEAILFDGLGYLAGDSGWFREDQTDEDVRVKRGSKHAPPSYDASGPQRLHGQSTAPAPGLTDRQSCGVKP